MSKPQAFSRRQFLGSLLATAGASAAPFALNLAAMSKVAAATTGDYKALVCLFMTGGNDQANTVLATDPASWSGYLAARATDNSGAIALPSVGSSGGVLPIVPRTTQAGRSFALHPQLAPLKNLFDDGRAAIVANVGTLLAPTTLLQYNNASVPLPPKLFSHNDQQSTWQSFQPEGASAGWGGRMAELLSASGGNTSFASVSAAGNAVFLAGNSLRQYQISAAGAQPVAYLDGILWGTPATANPVRSIISGTRTDPFENEHTEVMRRALAAQSTMSAAMLPVGAGGVAAPGTYLSPISGTQAVNPLAEQLQTVARVIGGRGTLGVGRQVFFVSLSGFDTHDYQALNHADALARVAHAIAYFEGALATLGGLDMRSQVTLFTASDFGRTFASNGDGTDHGWGSHHFVVGGAVRGKDIYGGFPVTGLGHSLDVGAGSLLPTSSVDQYGATLASWFGLSATQIADVFPHIGNFSNPNLGFML